MLHVAFIVVLLGTVLLSAEECPPCDKGDSLPSLTMDCICRCLADSKKNTAELIPLLDKFASRRKISDTLLFCAWRTGQMRNNESLFAHLLHLWKMQTPAPAFRLQELQRASQHRTADTLFMILDKANDLDPFLLLRWIDTKIILDEIERIPEIACRITAGSRELLPMVFDKLTELFTDLTPKQSASLLAVLYVCIAEGDKATAEDAADWMIGQLGMLRCYSDQLALARKHPAGAGRQVELLESIARQLLATKKQRESCNAGLAAYPLAADTLQKKEIAGIIYQSYQGLGMADSARFWFERSAEKSGKPTCESVETSLALGKLDVAGKAFKLLPESFVKDTLFIRYLLLCDSPKVAFVKAFDSRGMLARSPLKHVWRVRTALFSGRLDTCAALLKEYQPTISDKAAPELLDYRLLFTYGEENPEGLAKFAQIAYTLYKSDLTTASQVLCNTSDSSELAWRLAVRVARRQSENRAYKAARRTLDCKAAVNEPEYLYCLADVLYNDGDKALSRKILERILNEHGSGMYASQARLLLSKLGK